MFRKVNMTKDALLSKVAEGFYRSAVEHKAVPAYREDLKFFVWNLEVNDSYFKFLKSPFVDYKEKCASLDNIFGKVFIPEMLAFIKILITKELISDISKIRKIFNRLADKDANIIEGKIYTPFKLTNDQIFKISEAFSKKLNKKVLLSERRDESLIGGVKVVLDGIVYEYSVSSKLENVRNNLIKNITKAEVDSNE